MPEFDNVHNNTSFWEEYTLLLSLQALSNRDRCKNVNIVLWAKPKS